MRLKNKIAVITGAGSGFGRASAYTFAKEGARIVVADVNDSTGEDTVENIISRNGEALFVHTDVTKGEDLKRLIKATIDRFGRLDIMVNNAGMGGKTTPVEDVTEEEWDRIIELNLKSIFLGSKYAVPVMKKSGGGVIINTGSDLGVRPKAGMCAYVTSKGAVITLTKELAVELAPFGIRVNCVNPGPADTPLLHSMHNEERINALSASMPLINRLIQPEDVAAVVLFLASDEAATLSGECINVNGGRAV